jgi:CDP-glycerol glycerophosphotransferase (TagB/SpsB family)
MNWPLIICEESLAETCRTYYPDLDVRQIDLFDLQLPSCLVTCDSRPLLQAALGPLSSKILWMPHGQSDKGWKTPFFEALAEEDLLLVYGQRMRDVLLAKKISIPQISIGSFRWLYMQKHKPFYEQLLAQHFQDRRFTLYAPTWEDRDRNGTLFEALPALMKTVPTNLLIKLHPNTLRAFAPQIERLIGLAGPSALFLEEFPPIYPLLSRCDAYIGDMSSIGYDFLHFQKPLAFLCRQKTDPWQDPSAYLMRFGKQLLLNEISHLFPLQPPDPAALSHAFDPIDWPEIRKQIEQFVTS